MKIRTLTRFWWVVLAAFLYLSPFLLFPAFNIIDDGASLQLAERIVKADSWGRIADVLIEDQVGRFRPVYHLTFTGMYALVGFRPFFFWLTQALFLGLTLMGMAVFLYRVTKRYWLSALLPLTLLLSPTVSQNMYRLGTAEPKQMFFWIWMLVILSYVTEKGWKVWSFLTTLILFILALLTKETSAVFAAMMGIVAIWQLFSSHKARWTSWVQVGLLGLAIVLFYLVLPKAGSYSSGFKIVPLDIWQRLLAARLEHAAIFFPLLGTLVGDVVYQVTRWRSQKSVDTSSLVWSALLLSQLALVLVIGILPWQHQLPRYYYPVYLISLLYIGVTIPNLLKLVSRFEGLKLSTQLFLIGMVAVGATLVQLRVFQSGVGLSFDPALMYHRLLQFRIESAFFIFLLLVGVTATLLRLSLKYLATGQNMKFELNDFLWPALGLGLGGSMIFLSVAIWQHQWPRNKYALVALAVSYGLLEMRAWLRLRNKSWWGSVKLGPRIAFSIMAVVMLLVGQSQLLVGRGLHGTQLVTGVWQDLQVSFDTHQISYALLKDLYTSTPPHSKIFVVGDDYEIVFEIGLYASQFSARPIELVTSNQQLVTDVGHEYPYLRLNSDPITSYQQASSPKQLILRKQTYEAMVATGSAGIDSPELQPTALRFKSASEKQPAQVFGVIPDGANWVVAE